MARESEPPAAPSSGAQPGAKSATFELDYEEETVRTNAPSEIARQMRDQIKRKKR